MIGIDIVDIKRIKKIIKKTIFIDRVFSENEKIYLNKKNFSAETVAGMWAAKEAFVKALGTGFKGIQLNKIEILHDKNNKPYIEYKKNAYISISHDKDYAIAVVYFNKNSNINKKINSEFFIKKRKVDSHKGDYGKVAIIGGQIGMSGSVVLASKAALRSGCGYVYTIVPESISNIVQTKLNEQIIIGLKDKNGAFSEESFLGLQNFLNDFDAIAIGPGIGTNEETYKFLEKIITNYSKPIVVDADAINLLSKYKIKFSDIILTPHKKEFLTMINSCNMKDANNKEAKEFAKDKKSIVVLKGNNTYITDGIEDYINNTGNPGMATAGSGDVLTGIIASMISQGYEKLFAAKIAVYLHGLSGDIAKKKLGEDSIIASDLIKFLPKAIKLLKKI